MTGIVDPYDYKYGAPVYDKVVCLKNKKEAREVFQALDKFPDSITRYIWSGGETLVKGGLNLFELLGDGACLFLLSKRNDKIVQMRIAHIGKKQKNYGRFKVMSAAMLLKRLTPKKIKPKR